MGCPMNDYDEADGTCSGPCPCHFSSFDLSRDGVVVVRPGHAESAPRPVSRSTATTSTPPGVFRLVYGHDDNLAGEQLVVVAGEVQ